MPPSKRRLTRTTRDLGPMPLDCFITTGWCMEDTANHPECPHIIVSSLTGATYTCRCGCHK